MAACMVSGHSDDTVYIHRGRSKQDIFEISAWDHDVHITFDDGTEILCEYRKGAWKIAMSEEGCEWWKMSEAFDRCGDKTTDVFLINADIVHYELMPRKE